MITAFAGSKAAEAFLFNVNNWRWGFGIFAIIVPAICIPLFALLKLQLRKAEQRGLIQEQIHFKVTLQSVWKNIVAFDCESSTLLFVMHEPEVYRVFHGLTKRYEQCRESSCSLVVSLCFSSLSPSRDLHQTAGRPTTLLR